MLCARLLLVFVFPDSPLFSIIFICLFISFSFCVAQRDRLRRLRLGARLEACAAELDAQLLPPASLSIVSGSGASVGGHAPLLRHGSIVTTHAQLQLQRHGSIVGAYAPLQRYSSTVGVPALNRRSSIAAGVGAAPHALNRRASVVATAAAAPPATSSSQKRTPNAPASPSPSPPVKTTVRSPPTSPSIGSVAGSDFSDNFVLFKSRKR